jgi:hypothetical protein
MGMFDNMFDGKSAARTLGPADAFAGILLCASACDKHIDELEIADLLAITGRMKMFQALSKDEWNAMMAYLSKSIERDGVDKLLEKCVAALPEEWRDCVFANTCDLILADGVVEEEEKAFLDQLQAKLQVEGDTAVGIVEVMLIKNKG